MKRPLAWLAGVLLAGLVVVLVVTCAFSPTGHYDFSLRMNELACVRQRVNPYDVWHGDISLPPYYPNAHVGEPPDGCTKQVNAYAPWEYVAMLPFSLLPEDVAWAVYCVLMGLALAALLYLPRRDGESDSFLKTAIPLLAVAYPIWSNAGVGNFAVIVLTASVAMACALNRRRDVLAGLCWTVVMLKPQIGLAFAIPLLLRRKWLTLFVAGGVCLFLSVVAAAICRTSPVDLLLQAPAASVFAFLGCGTWPRFLCGATPGNGDILAGLAVGAIACAAMTWRLRKVDDWFTFLMPAAITSCGWTYTQAYSHAMGWFVAFALVRALLRTPRSKALWCLAALAAVSLSRTLLAAHGLCAFVGWPFPMSEYAFRCVDSLNSTVSLAVAAALTFLVPEEGLDARRSPRRMCASAD